jgi:hypothetical protein
LFKRSGDEAFLAGLMQDLGVLVMLRELGSPYAGLVQESMKLHDDLADLERATLGFDHVQLTAGLLAHWNMPDVLVRAVAEPRSMKRLAKSRDEHAALTRVLHLAELLAQLVGQHRLSVLPDLLEAGRLYCDMTKSRLTDLVAMLEPKVRQLASVLSLDLAATPEYSTLLALAHAAMARVAESIAGPASHVRDSQPPPPADVRKTHPPTSTVSMSEVHAAVARFLEKPLPAAPAPPPAGEPPRSVRETWTREDLAAPPAKPLPYNQTHLAEFDIRLTLALGECRAMRQPLSVIVVGAQALEPLPPEQTRTLDRVIEAACRGATHSVELTATPVEGRRVIALPGRDRQEAIVAARGVVDRVQQLVGPLNRGGQLVPCLAAAGVASVAEPAKNFRGERLLETAERCLTAALASGGVKSLEVI